MFTKEDDSPSVFKIHERKFPIHEVFTFASTVAYLLLIYALVNHFTAEAKTIVEDRPDSKRNKQKHD